ncbi:MAG: DUF4191 domain-containing protein [Propionibacteriaceae bacterium]|jgi:hypothetical protein|nr:DUF4191 domain-containing protein [Propionibacteriaceae bacterium]
MASERAKELAAKQKAEMKAAKLAKKTSQDPKDWGWFKQITQTVKMTVSSDPESKWWLIGAGLLGLIVVSAIGFFLEPWWMYLIMGVMAGVIAAMYTLVWRAKKATYKRFEGQAGAAEVALGMLNKKKWSYTSPVTATRQMDVLHRAVGQAGIVLIGEGAPSRVKTLLAAEAKKHEQIVYGVPVTTIVMGDGEGQVPLNKLTSYINALPKKIRKLQITETNQRLRALDAARPKIPMPKGPLVAPKGANKALRGR